MKMILIQHTGFTESESQIYNIEILTEKIMKNTEAILVVPGTMEIMDYICSGNSSWNTFDEKIIMAECYSEVNLAPNGFKARS